MKRILIADDEQDILKVVKYRLVKAGFEVLVALNGKEALEMVKSVKPDLILLDYSMPFVTGDEVCLRIKADPETRNIPVILMTASIKIVEEETVKKVGADAHLLKPFEPEELFEKIKQFVK